MIPLHHSKGSIYAVFGLARSGLAAARALVRGGAEVRVWDDNAASRLVAEQAGFKPLPLNDATLSGCAALVLAPGVPLTHPAPHDCVAAAARVGVPVIGDIELLLREMRPAANDIGVYGVTGTNGKSTTTALLAHVLNAAGREIAMGGNIGVPVLELPRLAAQGSAYLLEMSSFQIDLTPGWQARIAVLLNITPDHLDRHGDMARYAAIKARIFAGQGAGDTAIIGLDDEYCRAIHAALLAEASGRQIIGISAERVLAEGISAVAGKLYENGTEIAELARFPALPGKHNGQNIAAVYAAARTAGLDAASILKAVESFPGLKHRLQQLGKVDGIACVNDSKATNAEAAEKALACYDGIYWIAGGKAKEGGIAPLKPLFPRIRHAFLIGAAAADFAATLGEAVPHTISGNLEQAVAQGLDMARRDHAAGTAGDAVLLLSPACASYDQFKSFEHRGEEFIRLIQQRQARGEAA
ncbi:UDP-N-acetylmuramoyl-L-alanine--D-glutamate ligase [Ferrovibrio sp.]|uniref:UDP-N-acetylmuramoyl-L-alanine--D-glutamate ligase n=1 Tax=Ferrovibrio sp. TaxID=1917215 RepID=UPI001B678789|nr:UDP-N-acetylmuramoyl-L-alanine--D-glutamate ligase [Ferrovibrio sp.]MBP7065406.1 UDP-N-acetylmuramoyl-L-alanine--D-glutamate ligase [Ferrovibrio sp.]